MPNKEGARAGGSGSGTPAAAVAAKPSTCSGSKPPVIKMEPPQMSSPVPACAPAVPVSPGAGGSSADELLGSLTTEQQQRTSARVIKKLRLDSALDDNERDKRDATEGAPDKIFPDKESAEGKAAGGGAGAGAKQRMPKALWSSDEKSLFFEALNEYGKDFDAITDYIRAKMKRKGPASGSSAKTKNQVSHFYYRTWHKLSKHTCFGDNVKKVAQELYALINYGEMRRKLSAGVNEKTCSRLQELITRGTILLRARGRSLRLRTPQCRALRALNHISEYGAGVRVPTRVTVVLRARSAAAWARVQTAAHNPRVALSAPLRTALRTMLHALHTRWDVPRTRRDPEYGGRRTALHVGPRAGLELHAPTVAAVETPHTHKICFSSYLERLRAHGAPNPAAKLRTPKRQRKDSGTEKEKDSTTAGEKRARTSETECEIKSGLHLEEAAIDGIELMATLSTEKDCKLPEPPPIQMVEMVEEQVLKSEEAADEVKTEDGTDTEEVREEEVVKEEEVKDEEVEREKDSFSELEEEEKCYETDGDTDRPPRRSPEKFRNLKVKFRVRTKKNSLARSYSVVRQSGEDKPPAAHEAVAREHEAVAREHEAVAREHEAVAREHEAVAREHEAVAREHEAVAPAASPRLDVARRQAARGWSAHDAGQLTLGDLYLMFGSESRVELDYWWCPPSAPLSPPALSPEDSKFSANADAKLSANVDGRLSANIADTKMSFEGKALTIDTKVSDTRAPGAEGGLLAEGRMLGGEEREGSDTELLSPRLPHYNHDSNDALSGDERKRPEEGGPALRLTDKLRNRSDSPHLHHQHLLTLTSRLRRLLALAAVSGAPAAGGAGLGRGGGGACACGHVCPQRQRRAVPLLQEAFRQPTIAPKPDPIHANELCLDGLPRWRRGRPPGQTRDRVVVQRLLPLLPKPTHTLSAPDLIPVTMVSTCAPATTPVAILPRPSSLITSVAPSQRASYVYVLSASGNTPAGSPPTDTSQESEGVIVTKEESLSQERATADSEVTAAVADVKQDSRDNFTGFLSSESLSIPCLSPSRLLRDADGAWLERDVHDFSLSSFLGHLDGTAPPPPAEVVDSQLQCMMQESSIDYMAKFADLAAEVGSDSKH